MTRPFCPHGYLTSQDVFERALLEWFPGEIAALNAAAARELAIDDKPNGVNQEPTSVEALALALASPSWISDKLRHQIADVLTRTDHRLRGLLHQGVAAAYYFGGLTGQGRHVVGSEFWATPEAESVLPSGTIWPFGKPPSFYEQRPSFPLFLLEADLNALLSADPNSTFENEPSLREFGHPDPAMTSATQEPEDGHKAVDENPRELASQSKPRKRQPAFERARRVIEELYPEGVPDMATESNKKLCKRVSEKLGEPVSPDTILRAAGRRK